MNLFEKLLQLKELRFGDGEISLLDSRVVLVQTDLFAEYGLRINNSPEKTFEFYDSIKTGFKGIVIKIMGRNYSFVFNDFFKWLTDVANMAGWGKVKWEMLDVEKRTGVLVVEGSPIAVALKGKVKYPVDDMIRGFIAGGASASLKTDIDAVELDCSALGAPLCRFLFKPFDEFDFSKPEVIRQLGAKKNQEPNKQTDFDVSAIK